MTIDCACSGKAAETAATLKKGDKIYARVSSSWTPLILHFEHPRN
jgi:hypothetical protein